MKKLIINKPYGLSTKQLTNYLKSELKINKLYCLDQLEKNIDGVITYYLSDKYIDKIDLNKINNTYLLVFNTNENQNNIRKNIILELKKYQDLKKINFSLKDNNINTLNFIIEINNKLNIKISDISKFLIKNIKEIQSLKSISRIKNYKYDLKKSIYLDEIFLKTDRVEFLNDLKKNNFNIDNLIIGQFDLIHKGHIKLLNNKNISILTFINNPSKKEEITSINYRVKKLLNFNPKKIFIYDIKKENISEYDFIEKYLKKINPKKILVGSDFKFGKNATGNIDSLKKHFDVIEIIKQEKYSTKLIKEMIKKNEFKKMNSLLNEDFYFEGIIIKGKQLGKKIGFPTANVNIKTSFPFENGSYCTKVFINNKWMDSISFINSIKDGILLETHILNFSQNIYGLEIKVFPLFFIRKKEKFYNNSELIKKIKNDIKISENGRKKYEK